VACAGSLVREEPQARARLTQALIDAAMFTSQNPDKAAKSFQPYAPRQRRSPTWRGMVRYHTHHHHPSATSSSASSSLMA